MLYANPIPAEMIEPPEKPQRLHINDLTDKSAGNIALHTLQRDKYHRRIAAAADFLVKQERGELRYGGQYADGSTLWLDAAGVGDIVRVEEVTLWVAA